MKERILIIGDTHFPFHSHNSLQRIYDLTSALNPTIIIQIGDLYDMYSFAKFPRSQNIMTPKAEIEQAHGDAWQMWDKLKKLCPKAKCFQLKGNHDDRAVKRALESFSIGETLLDLRSIWDFPKVEVLASERDELIIKDMVFMHGFRSKIGDHAAHNGRSTICGHSHLGGVVYMRLGDKTLFELNAGYIGDEYTKPLSYTRQRRISKWTQGVGWIDHLGPRFIAFPNL